ncbi:MAG: tannase/feruloyl esterase family alpha/beta hydrolase [Alphaproteobacteria bacterium]
MKEYSGAEWSVRKFDKEADLKAAKNGIIGVSVAAENPDLSAFAKRGGKMLHWHGWHDMGIPARNSIRYYNEVINTMGQQNVDAFYRLFLGTGVGHCSGGYAPDSIGSAFGKPAAQRDAEHDVMEALVAWIEDDNAPEKIIATQYDKDDTTVVAQRTWCPYPKVALWDGQGNRNKAKSYSCSQ